MIISLVQKIEMFVDGGNRAAVIPNSILVRSNENDEESKETSN
jgi:hypothetical protein